ncbi:hypothetical protein Q8A73_022639 [Channa argus]|nr:hypothetical protein Q8A73_022639 [Channa argus]
MGDWGSDRAEQTITEDSQIHSTPLLCSSEEHGRSAWALRFDVNTLQCSLSTQHWFPVMHYCLTITAPVWNTDQTKMVMQTERRREREGAKWGKKKAEAKLIVFVAANMDLMDLHVDVLQLLITERSEKNKAVPQTDARMTFSPRLFPPQPLHTQALSSSLVQHICDMATDAAATAGTTFSLTPTEPTSGPGKMKEAADSYGSISMQTPTFQLICCQNSHL